MGQLRSRERTGPGYRLGVETTLGPLSLGESVAVNGACLTVTSVEPWGFMADVSRETATRTTLGRASMGARLNLERALCVGARMGGHWVAGHIDGVARVVGRNPAGEALCVDLMAPAALERFIAEKGSVCLDGVSLTVNEATAGRFSVMLIPHTVGMTNLEGISPGREMNLEVDLIARYVARVLEAGTVPQGATFLEALGKVER